MTERFVRLVNDQRAALLGLLTTLPADGWSRMSPIRGWPVHDVVAHLVEGELLFGRVYRGELKAITREDADPQAGVERWTHADGDTLRFSLWHHGSAAQRVIDSRSEDSWRREVALFDTPVQLRHVLRLHFFDLAIHSHDVTTALEKPHEWGERVPFIVEYCIRGAPGVLKAAAVALPGGIDVDVAEAGSWSLRNRDGAWVVGDAEDPDAGALASWKTDAETLVLATTGRLDPDEAIGRTHVEGDTVGLRDVLAAWQVKAG